jgi:hypothetical protein
MALIFENSKEFQDNKYTIPKEVGQVINAYDKSYEAQDPHFAMTLHRVIHRLADNGESYNEKKGKNGENQQAATLTANDAKRIKGIINHTTNLKSPKKSIVKDMGTMLKRVCDDAIGDARRKNQQVKAVKPPKPTAANNATKPAEVKTETTPKGVKYQLAASRKINVNGKKVYLSETQVMKIKHKLD